jgi:hypothetical protein
MTIKAIETKYNGYRFRSRLEARWAVFFDRLGIAYEYEAQGYLVNGTPYLPDFKLILPNGEVLFAEVKDGEVDEHEGEHIRLCQGLAAQSKNSVLLLTGPPAYRMYDLFAPDLPTNSRHAAFFSATPPFVTIADEYWFQSVELDEKTGYLNFTHDERGRRKSFGRALVAAVEAARGARFEHNGDASS